MCDDPFPMLGKQLSVNNLVWAVLGLKHFRIAVNVIHGQRFDCCRCVIALAGLPG